MIQVIVASRATLPDDFDGWTSEQIQAFFEGIGEVLAAQKREEAASALGGSSTGAAATEGMAAHPRGSGAASSHQQSEDTP